MYFSHSVLCSNGTEDHVVEMICGSGLWHNCQQGPNRGLWMSSRGRWMSNRIKMSYLLSGKAFNTPTTTRHQSSQVLFPPPPRGCLMEIHQQATSQLSVVRYLLKISFDNNLRGKPNLIPKETIKDCGWSSFVRRGTGWRGNFNWRLNHFCFFAASPESEPVTWVRTQIEFMDRRMEAYVPPCAPGGN